MKDLGAVGLPAPFHALFDSCTTPQAISSDRRPSKNRLLVIPQDCRRNELVTCERARHTCEAELLAPT